MATDFICSCTLTFDRFKDCWPFPRFNENPVYCYPCGFRIPTKIIHPVANNKLLALCCEGAHQILLSSKWKLIQDQLSKEGRYHASRNLRNE